MTISTRTPEGDPHRCAICGGRVFTAASEPLGDSVCPRCGALLIRFHENYTDQRGIDRKRVTADTTLKELGADSLDTVELVMQLEEEYDINIPDSEAESIKTIGDLFRWIRRQRGFLDDDEQRWKR